MWEAFIQVMITILLYIYDLIGHNFGLAIIIFTILIRLLLYPLTRRQVKSSKAMQEMQESEEWKKIQEKYKDDRETLAQKQMEFYQEMGINPFGSCLPTLLQLPIIIGLYRAVILSLAVTPVALLNLSKYISDGAQLIPINSQFLWMELSEPERLQIFGVGVPVLAIIVLITSYLQTKLISTSTQPTGDDGGQAAQMSQAMSLYMPIFMGYLALTFASGLAIYFIASNLVSILQYVLMGRADLSQVIPKQFRPS
jgi:YidC/Oxa1 family membrane protein insertase